MKYLTIALLVFALSACSVDEEQAAGIACQEFAKQAGHTETLYPVYTSGTPGGTWRVLLGRYDSRGGADMPCEVKRGKDITEWTLRKLG
jgi:hypothetical protein